MSPRPPYKPRDAAVKVLQWFFSHQPDAEVVLLEDIYEAAGRQGIEEKQNKKWLSEYLTVLRHYDLVTGVYSPYGRRKLAKLQLTPEGRKALQEANGNWTSEQVVMETTSTATGNGGEAREERVSLDQMLRIVARFQKENPSYKIIFEIRS